MKSIPLALIALVSCLMQAAAAEERQAAGAAAYLSSDSEDFSVRRASLMLLKDYQHLDGKTGLRYSTVEYSQNDWSRRGQQLSFLHHQMNPRLWSGWMLDAGLLQQGGHETFTLDTSYRKAFSAQSGVEVFANRDVVETRNALEAGRAFTFIGASADAGMSPHWTAVGLLGFQSFNDGNERRHVRTRIVYQPNLDIGLTLQMRYRYFDSSQLDVGRAYFNPERYDEGLLAIAWRGRIQGWKSNLVAGAGRQRVNSDPQAPTQLLEGSFEKQMENYALRFKSGYSRSAAFGGPDYRWSYINAELIIPF